MKIRTKLMLSMSILIAFILLCLFFVTHVQFYIVRDLAYAEQKAAFEALREEFEQYYTDHKASWRGVQNYPFANSRHFAEIALFENGNEMYRKGRLSPEIMRDEAFSLILHANDRKIGRLFVMNERQYKTYEFKAMWYGIFPSITRVALLFTCIAALVTISLLSWRLTAPIRKIIQGIDAIKMGKPHPALPVHRKDEFGAISRALHEMNESLEKMERSRKQLLSDVAHELKTPLMIIQGELELAQDTGLALPPEKLSSLHDEVLRLSRLVHDVLHLSRLEAGGMTLRPASENIVAILEGLIEKTQFLAEEKHIRISMHPSKETIAVPVEKHRILQALYNIVINAIHYTDRGGQVQIRVEQVYQPDRRMDYVRITIEDNGVGIPEEDLPHIFNRFYRADHSRTRSNGGTGLGLAIAQQNILLHQGWIEVQSKAGKGTAFAVFLPAASGDFVGSGRGL
ncbi:HAMP domain-containing sensor histidine kinase [Paenibacillus ehimensis]|uniref:sensor histidine kinase n=1 Tax=Paenibacillus ehimensis TaxID=79264 RepID=UPI002DB71392|nr:HAMP domain-containing sensor histidine kinase [Paenibacillus ehimensis]MEC0211047.1 HAMP domain-containing sensor histidine kinase [Paenibacillus ehimensis]